MQVRIQVTRAPEGEGLPLPTYARPGDAGMDLLAAIEDEVTLQPGARARISTGLRIAVPPGYEAQIRPRSGLADRHGISMVNSPGTIDSGFRGTVCLLLINHGQEPFTLKRGDRIGQMVIAPVARAVWEEVDELPSSERGEGGFGHTGLASDQTGDEVSSSRPPKANSEGIRYTDRLTGITPEKLDGFFVGWPNPPSRETHLRLLQQSDEIVLAILEPSGEVVGFITALSDGVLSAYIAHLEVLPAYQRRGIGRELLRRMIERLSGLYGIDLLCDPPVQAFYERCGMRPAAGMCIRNYERQAGPAEG